MSFRVSETCGDAPFHFAKNEAHRLLERISERMSVNPRAELVLDFADVVGVSASGAVALVKGIARRFGQWDNSRVLFRNVDDNLISSLEDAVADVDQAILNPHPPSTSPAR